MNHYLLQIVLLKIIVFLSLLILCHCSPTQKFFQPNFSFHLIQENEKKEIFSLEKINLLARYVILNVFAPNCPPCVDELPDIKKISEASLKEKSSFFFIALGSNLNALSLKNSPQEDTILSELEKFRKKYSLEYPIYFADSKILRSFGVTGFPETFIFAREENKNTLKLVKKIISSVSFGNIKEYQK